MLHRNWSSHYGTPGTIWNNFIVGGFLWFLQWLMQFSLAPKCLPIPYTQIIVYSGSSVKKVDWSIFINVLKKYFVLKERKLYIIGGKRLGKIYRLKVRLHFRAHKLFVCFNFLKQTKKSRRFYIEKKVLKNIFDKKWYFNCLYLWFDNV